MKISYDAAFYRKLKKVNVRIRKLIKEKILLFSKDPNNTQLNNHQLKDRYQGFRSININNDYRAIYQEATIAKEKLSLISSHLELTKSYTDNIWSLNLF